MSHPISANAAYYVSLTQTCLRIKEGMNNGLDNGPICVITISILVVCCTYMYTVILQQSDHSPRII